MTRKITLSVILILLIVGCYQVVFGNQPAIRKSIASVSELDAKSKALSTDVAKLEKSSTTDFKEKKENLAKTIKEYNSAKEEYETLMPQSSELNASQIAFQESLKDIYDVDFLWTIIGNYATEEGINLKFDISKNTTSASSINNTSNTYIVCDLKFTITGNYINLTDFIYDLEDDDRLNFEINSFDMQKDGDGLQVTFTVEEIKLNNTNLIDSVSTTSSQSEVTQEINSNTTSNTTNTNTTSTNTTNTSTTNTASSNTISNKVN